MPREKEKARAKRTFAGFLVRAGQGFRSRSSDRIERQCNELGGRWFKSSRERQQF